MVNYRNEHASGYMSTSKDQQSKQDQKAEQNRQQLYPTNEDLATVESAQKSRQDSNLNSAATKNESLLMVSSTKVVSNADSKSATNCPSKNVIKPNGKDKVAGTYSVPASAPSSIGQRPHLSIVSILLKVFGF